MGARLLDVRLPGGIRLGEAVAVAPDVREELRGRVLAPGEEHGVADLLDQDAEFALFAPHEAREIAERADTGNHVGPGREVGDRRERRRNGRL